MKLAIVQDLWADQLPDLLSPFEKTRPQVDIKNMEGGLGYFNIGAQAATMLASLCSNVMVSDRSQRKTTEQQVAVCATIETAVFTKVRMEAELCGNELRLIFFGMPMNAKDFLQRDDIRISFAQHLHNTRWVHAAVKSTAFVNVVGQNPDAVRHISELL